MWNYLKKPLPGMTPSSENKRSRVHKDVKYAENY
jgi:hypothetical protein